MPTTRTRSLVGLVALVLLLTGALGGAAVAQAKIKGKQIAKNAIATKHLRSGAVTGDKLAAGAVTGAKLAADTVTGAQVDESSLTTVPDAAAVGGIRVVPIQLSLPDPTGVLTPLFTDPSLTISVGCSSATSFEVQRTADPSPVTFESSRASLGFDMESMGPGAGSALGADAANYTVTVFGPGTRSTVILVQAVHKTDAFGGTNDCFFRGTVTSTP